MRFLEKINRSVILKEMIEALELDKWEAFKGQLKIDFAYEMSDGEYHCTANEGEYFVTLKYFPAERKPKNLHSFDLSVFDTDLIGVYIGETEYELKYSYPALILTTDDIPTPEKIIEVMDWGPCDDIFTMKF